MANFASKHYSTTSQKQKYNEFVKLASKFYCSKWTEKIFVFFRIFDQTRVGPGFARPHARCTRCWQGLVQGVTKSGTRCDRVRKMSGFARNFFNINNLFLQSLNL